MERRDTGNIGEKLARDYLKKHGYSIVQTNFRCRNGEVDIIARQKKTLVFVEVRTKRNLEYGTPEESITRTKSHRLRATAYYYLKSLEKQPASWRIDFVAVELDDQDKATRIELIENAVGEEES